MDNKNQPAFPFFEYNENGYGESVVLTMPDGSRQFLPYKPGLTKRELAFFMALGGFMAAKPETPNEINTKRVAIELLEYVDAGFEALEKQPAPNK